MKNYISKKPYTNTVLDNGLVPDRRKAFIQTIYGEVFDAYMRCRTFRIFTAA